MRPHLAVALAADRTSVPGALRFAVHPHAERVLVEREDYEGLFADFEPERDVEVLAAVIEDLLLDLITPHGVFAACEDDGARLLVYVRGAHGRTLRLASEHTEWPKFGDRTLRGTAFAVSVARECADLANSTLVDLNLATGYTAPTPPGPHTG